MDDGIGYILRSRVFLGTVAVFFVTALLVYQAIGVERVDSALVSASLPTIPLASTRRPSIAVFLFFCNSPDSSAATFLLDSAMNFPLFVHNCSEPDYNDLGCGGEGRAYLQFILKWYDQPPADILVFGHGHSTAWHYPEAFFLRLHKLAASSPRPGAPRTPAAVPPHFRRDFGEVYCEYVNSGYSPKGYWAARNDDMGDLWNEMYKHTAMQDYRRGWEAPGLHPCCGTFFVSAEAIHRRPKKFYRQVLKNMENTDPRLKGHGICGRVLESSWHIIFTQGRANKINDCSEEKKSLEQIARRHQARTNTFSQKIHMAQKSSNLKRQRHPDDDDDDTP